MAYEIIDNFFSSDEDEITNAAGSLPFQPADQSVPDEGFSFQWFNELHPPRGVFLNQIVEKHN